MKLGSVTLNLRIRVEAGVGGSLNEVGHIDTTVPIPLKATMDGATLHVEPQDVPELISEILDAAAKAATKPVNCSDAFPRLDRTPTAGCPDHHLVQHRDGKPPWCRSCGHTAEGRFPQGSINSARQALGLPPYEEKQTI